MAITLKEALNLADEAVENGYLNKYPQACIVLAKEVKRLQKLMKNVPPTGSNPPPMYAKPVAPPGPTLPRYVQ
jgi:hypothetical protein